MPKSLLEIINDQERGSSLGRILQSGSPNIPYDFGTAAKENLFYTKDLYAHFGCINSVGFDPSGSLMVSGGDDKRVILWKTETTFDESPGKFRVLDAEHLSNIFCLSFSTDGKSIFSGGNDEQVIDHDVESGKPTNYYPHEQVVYGVDAHPLNPRLFATACSNGRVTLFDTRCRETSPPALLVADFPYAFHRVVFNPVEPLLIATANQKMGIGLFDTRLPKKTLMEYGNAPGKPQSAMAVDFNETGTRLVGLRRRLSPVLFDIHSPRIVAEFDHPGYYNNSTMKSCGFAGFSDEFIVTGSDDFRIYMWRIPDYSDNLDLSEAPVSVPSAEIVFGGHRSIANHVKFNKQRGFLASCGVEKMVKLWSPYYIPGSLIKKNYELVDRQIYNHDDYISLVIQSGNFMSHDYSTESTRENPRMMAFFDSMVHREIQGLSSEEDDEEEDDSSSTDEDGGRLSPLSAESRLRIFEIIEAKRRQLKRAAECRKRRRLRKLEQGSKPEQSDRPYMKKTIDRARKLLLSLKKDIKENNEDEEEEMSSHSSSSSSDISKLSLSSSSRSSSSSSSPSSSRSSSSSRDNNKNENKEVPSCSSGVRLSFEEESLRVSSSSSSSSSDEDPTPSRPKFKKTLNGAKCKNRNYRK